MSRTNNSYFAILGILGFGPMSGYGIKIWVDEGIGYFWEIDYKQIYPTLKKIEDEDLVTYKIEKKGNRPESKVYTLTDKGIEELKNWLNKPINDGKQSINELRLKLFFGHHVSVEKNLEHLQSFKDSSLRTIGILEELKESLERKHDKDASWHYRMATVMSGEITRKAYVDWCNKAMEYIKNSQIPALSLEHLEKPPVQSKT